jgi:hypothetical protein
MGYRIISAIVLVMTFGDVLALLALGFLPQHLLAMMGGVRFSESDRLLIGVGTAVGCVGGLLLQLWLGGMVLVLLKCVAAWQLPLDSSRPKTVPSRVVWGLGIGSLVVWVLVLPWTQPEQILRWRVESNLTNGRIVEALDEMSAHDPSDFPPYWEPPPKPDALGEKPQILDIMAVIIEQPTALWVRKYYLEKSLLYLQGLRGHFKQDWRYDKLADRLIHLPEGPALAAEYPGAIERLIALSEEDLSESDRARLEDFIKAAGREPPERQK